ncbi:SixA phosphatase family protein [Amycolatopsis anabasis]|uniref:SixA phosphatase family protein n=1 Tax=Amycolatopsis anabasis TaxID=1840409 RepID=UPI00131C953C|nr:histidine phosphatase family protein [Amycolatopsis anabasis]
MTERRLVLLRHAKSAWPDGVPDFERPLNDRGRRDAPAAGRWLRENLPGLDLVLCSTAVRARQTWDLVAGELGHAPEVRHDDRLYAAATTTLLTVARELPGSARTVLIIAHNPGLEDLVSVLTNTDGQLKTSSIAVLTGSGDWSATAPGRATLTAFTTPRG